MHFIRSLLLAVNLAHSIITIQAATIEKRVQECVLVKGTPPKPINPKGVDIPNFYTSIPNPSYFYTYSGNFLHDETKYPDMEFTVGFSQEQTQIGKVNTIKRSISIEIQPRGGGVAKPNRKFYFALESAASDVGLIGSIWGSYYFTGFGSCKNVTMGLQQGYLGGVTMYEYL